jgi:hypothetical protein
MTAIEATNAARKQVDDFGFFNALGRCPTSTMTKNSEN